MSTLKEKNVRKMFRMGNTPVIAIPQDIAFETGCYVAAEKIDENTIKLTKVNVNVTPVETNIEKKPKIRAELTRDDLQRIEKDRNQKIELYIQKGFTKEDALIDFHYGFPVMQLIKYQDGKCGCGENLNVPEKGSSKEAYQGLSHQAMKNEDIIEKFDIIGIDNGCRLYCEKCSGI
jgi:hypothetical protein